MLWQQFRTAHAPNTAREKLVSFYYSHVEKIAKTVAAALNYHVDLDDLTSSGLIGLHKAISKYPDIKTDFHAFSYQYIRCAMYEELRTLDPLTRRQRAAFRMICRQSRILAAQNGMPPTAAEIAEHLDMTPDEVEIYIGMGSEIIDIHSENTAGTPLIELIPGSGPSPDDEINRKLAMESLYDAIQLLSVKERHIIDSRTDDSTVAQIADELSISKGRVTQVYQDAIVKLRKIVNTPKKKHES